MMTLGRTTHPYLLPGGKVSVATRRNQLSAMLSGAALFGPRYLKLLAAARSGDRTRLHRAEREWLARAGHAIGLTIETHDLHRVDPNEQYIVMPLHEGFADVIALARLPLDLAYTAASELFEWKLLGRYLMLSGQSPVPHADGPQAYRQMLRDARSTADAAESYVVFPQGSILGIEVAFHQGAFHVAAQTGLPILPIVLTGAAQVWQHPYSSILNYGRTIRMQVLEPIDASNAIQCARQVEAEMKRNALSVTPGPRRFDPQRDGWWDDYPYEIDPDFPGLASRVERHRRVFLTSAR